MSDFDDSRAKLDDTLDELARAADRLVDSLTTEDKLSEELLAGKLSPGETLVIDVEKELIVIRSEVPLTSG